jgi:hypothetical protein
LPRFSPGFGDFKNPRSVSFLMQCMDSGLV